jgi:hypothetical protein
MISWGLITCLTMLVNDGWALYLVRFLLGVAEAGFFPGIILYLTFWFPARERARVTAYFMMAIALASVIGNPLSGWCRAVCQRHLAAGPLGGDVDEVQGRQAGVEILGQLGAGFRRRPGGRPAYALLAKPLRSVTRTLGCRSW